MSRLLRFVGLFLWLAAPAQAADIAVLPVGLNLAGGQDRQAITVTNQGAEPVIMQVQTVSWSQLDGTDHYAPTHDLLVNPPLFTVPPGSSQVLRVGLRRPPNGEREVAYRLFLREVPPEPVTVAADGGNGKVRVLLELRLPVYVAPAKPEPDWAWRGRLTSEGDVAVEATNTGNVHQVVAGLKLRPAGEGSRAAVLAEAKTSVSVFPGQSHRWELRPRQVLRGRHFMLEVATDRGLRDVAIDLSQE